MPTMDKSSGVKDFFDISDKLSAPAKKSLRERQKEEAEAKRKREEEEAKAALKDFQKSLGVEEDDEDERPNDSGPSRIGTTRHFVPRGPRGNSGPGSLGPPPPSLSRKRGLDGSHKDQGLFAYSNSGPLDAATAFRDSDDEDERIASSKTAEKAIPKPTMRLSSLPPSITAAEIRSMIPSTLTVEAVNIGNNFDNRSGDRKSTSAIVTLAHNTPAKDIDAVVNALEKRYLGFGFNLSISRHLSSASLDTPAPGLANTVPTSLPFGAKTIPGAPGQSMSRAPPPPSLRGNQQFPPPYGSTQAQFGRSSMPTQITVKPPSDIKQLKLINKTIETLLNNGPEFEALLMSRPEVQRDQKWEWLWNARSPAGVWYRWKLWQTITGEETDPTTRSRFKALEQRVFYDSAPWVTPEQPLPFEFTTKFEEIVSDPEYDSSDEEASDDEAPRRQQHISGGPPEANFDTDDALKSYLNPLKKSKLTHLLARLPTSTARLRRGDVARVSAFAISHADKGADEIVNMLVTNIFKPFALTSANPDRQKQEDEAEQEENGDKKAEKEDPSSAKSIGLYIISDIFASCGTCGVRQAWRYREWFEAAFKRRNLFEHLGRLEKDLQWGRLRAEKWKRSINNILSMWDGGNVFSPAAQAHFVEVFNNPPLTEAGRQAAEKAEQEAARVAAKSKWKPVEVKTEVRQEEQKLLLSDSGAKPTNDDVDGEPMAEDVDGEPMGNGDVDGEPMDEDVDGEPMEEAKGDQAGEDFDGEPMEEETALDSRGQATQAEPKGNSETTGETEADLRPKPPSWSTSPPGLTTSRRSPPQVRGSAFTTTLPHSLTTQTAATAMSSADQARPVTPGSPQHRRRTSSLDFTRSPQSRRSSAAYSPIQARAPHGLHPAASYAELNGDGDDSFNAGEGGELGNLADELADAEEDDYEDGEGDASMMQSQIVDQNNAQELTNGHARHVSRDELLQTPKTTTTLSPSSKANHRRNRSRYDGSDYGSESDLEASDSISASLEAKMAAIEHLARRGTEDNGSATDGVFIRLTEQLRDLGSQAGVESGATRLITAHTALTTHLTHQTRLLTSLTSSLLSPLAPPLSPEAIDNLLPLIADALAHLPAAPPTPLNALANLSNQTHDFLDTVSYLSDSLHMGRQTSNLAQRRLKVVREAMGEWRRENELREEGIRWIEKGSWDNRLKEREAASVCNDVVGGFEEACKGWRERLVAMSEVPAA